MVAGSRYFWVVPRFRTSDFENRCVGLLSEKPWEHERSKVKTTTVIKFTTAAQEKKTACRVEKQALLVLKIYWLRASASSRPGEVSAMNADPEVLVSSALPENDKAFKQRMLADDTMEGHDEKKDSEGAPEKKKMTDWPLRGIKDPHDNDVLFGRGGKQSIFKILVRK
jgi:hypothetical protein